MKQRGIAFVALAVLILAQVACGGGSASQNDRFNACVMARSYMTQRLKSPATAQFQSCSSANIAKESDGVTWLIVSQVDSQNSFGATVRTTFSMRIRYKGGDKWELLDLETIP